jgi:hypothetical protein
MVTRTLDEEFLALVCEDSELLRAEFDAIVGANWRWPLPVPRSSPPVALPWPVAPLALSVWAAIDWRARQRSPPEGR